jgi:hypothetical protein
MGIRDFTSPREGYYGPAGAARKNAFHCIARRQLKAVADLLGLAPGTYDITTNKAGPGVSGETTLHGEHIHIQIDDGEDAWLGGILYRTCERRKGCGTRYGMNNNLSLDALDTPSVVAAAVTQMLLDHEILSSARGRDRQGRLFPDSADDRANLVLQGRAYP